MMNHSKVDKSAFLLSRASQVIPGGVNSPVRAFRAVGGTPRFISSARGCHLTDVDGNTFIDYVGSWGPMILGHAHPEVVAAVRDAAGRGTSYGAPTELEVELAERICECVPSIEKVRLVSSGTEATMSALRLARAATGRSRVVKFDGCYHGHADSFLVQAGSGIATLGLSDSPGVPETFSAQTISVPFNRLDALETVFERYAGEIAAVILEPVAGNMGVVLPCEGYLSGLLALSERHGALVIFDEVMTGFRLSLGGAQQLFSLQAPITCLGKILGGGLPIAAFGGKADLLGLIAPEGPVYQAGTLSGNLLAVTAGLKTLEILRRDPPYAELDRVTRRLCEGIESVARMAARPLQVQRCGSMFTLFFCETPVTDFASAKRSDTALFGRFFQKMLESGVYLAPSQFEACFVSIQHTDEIIDETVEKAERALRNI